MLTHSKFQSAIIAAQNGESAASEDILIKLEKLDQLRKQGILSNVEFEKEKRKILG